MSHCIRALPFCYPSSAAASGSVIPFEIYRVVILALVLADIPQPHPSGPCGVIPPIVLIEPPDPIRFQGLSLFIGAPWEFALIRIRLENIYIALGGNPRTPSPIGVVLRIPFSSQVIHDLLVGVMDPKDVLVLQSFVHGSPIEFLDRPVQILFELIFQEA